MELPAPALWHAFADGARVAYRSDGEAGTIRTRDAGWLDLPSGRVVASDPFLDPWCDPFSFRIAPAPYLVLLATIDDEAALVMIAFGEEPPVRWRMADPPSFGVDGGAGCLMDRGTSRFLRKKATAGAYERYSRRFQDALDEADGPCANVAVVDSPGGGNVVLFRTWGGDGRFHAYVGEATDGATACLVIDMHLDSHDVLGVDVAGPRPT